MAFAFLANNADRVFNANMFSDQILILYLVLAVRSTVHGEA